jgi:replicative DNA helicase
MIDRVPPSNIEAEKAVIGIMLQYPDKIAVVMDKLRAEHFYKSDNRRIYDVITKLFMGNKPVDTISVKSELKDVDSKNIDSYLIECMDSVPSGESWEHYSELIIETFKKRSIIIHGTNLIKAAQEGTPSTEIIDSFSDKMIKLQTNKDEVSMSEKMHEVNEMIETKETDDPVIGIPSGLEDLDIVLGGFQRKRLIVIAARPGIGKTSLAVNITRNALGLGRKVGFFSFEMTDTEILCRILAQEARVNSQSIENGTIRFNGQAMDKYAKAAGIVNSYIKNMYFDEFSRDIVSLKAKAKSWQLKHGIDMICVDYLQLMSIPQTGNVSESIGYITQNLKHLAKELNIPILLLSQLNRDSARDDREPQLHDLRSSGSIEQDANQAIFIHVKKGDPPEYWLLVKKNRHGHKRDIRIEFVPESTLFLDEQNTYQKIPF